MTEKKINLLDELNCNPKWISALNGNPKCVNMTDKEFKLVKEIKKLSTKKIVLSKDSQELINFFAVASKNWGYTESEGSQMQQTYSCINFLRSKRKLQKPIRSLEMKIKKYEKKENKQ